MENFGRSLHKKKNSSPQVAYPEGFISVKIIGRKSHTWVLKDVLAEKDGDGTHSNKRKYIFFIYSYSMSNEPPRNYCQPR